MTLAVFDIDGTLVSGSMERAFARHLFGKGLIGPRRALAYTWFTLRHLRRHGLLVAQVNKAYLAGLDAAELEALAARWVAGSLGGRLFEPAVTRLRWHTERGDSTLLLSGTLDWLARPLARALGVEQVLATVLDVDGGRCVARLPLRHAFGAAKAKLAEQHAREHGFDLADTFAYANSRHDLALLSAVGRPVAVLPDRKLLEAAHARGWEVLVDGRGPVAASAVTEPGA